MHDYCSFANHYFIIFSLTQSDSIPSSPLFFFFFISHTLFSSAQSINHLATTTQPTQPTTTILQHIKIQSQIQQKIKAKINKNQTKNQQKSNLKSTPTYQTENPNPPEALFDLTLTKAASPNPSRSPLLSHPCQIPLQTQATRHLPLPPLWWFHFFYFFFV